MANQITALLKLLGDASGAVKAIKQVDDSLSGLQKAGAQLSSIGKSMTTYVTAPMVGMATVAGKVAVDFDKAMMGVNSVLKLSGQEFQTLKQDVLSFSTTTSQSSKDVAMSLRGIVSSGFEATDAMTILRTTVDAAGNMMTDTATTTRAMTSVLQAFGMEATEVTHIADVMETAANASALQFEELTSSIGNAVGTAAAAGVSFEDTAAAMMTISDAGYSAAEASTALRSLMTEMLKPSDELAEAIQSWGYETGEAALQAEGLEGVIQLLTQTTGGSAAEMAELLGNIRAQKAAFALARDDGRAFADSMREVGEASAGAGEHAKMAEIRHQSWAYQLAKLKSELEVLTIRLAEGFMPAVIDIVVAAKDFATTMAELPQPILNTAVKVAALVAALGPLLMITGQVVTAIGTLASVIGPVIGSIGGLGAAALSGNAALAAMGGGAAAAGSGLLALLGPIAAVAAAAGTLIFVLKKVSDWEKKNYTDAERAAVGYGITAQQLEETTEFTRDYVTEAENANKSTLLHIQAEEEFAEAVEAAAIARGRAADAARLQAQVTKGAAQMAYEESEAQEALEAAIDRVHTLLKGPVRQANEQYLDSKAEIIAQMEEEQAKLDDLYDRHGQVVGSQEDLAIAQAKAQTASEKLASAQQALADNTDPDKQLQLEAAVAKAGRAMGKANDAVAAAGPHHVDLQGEIDKTKGKYSELQGQLEELAEAHRTALEDVALSMLEAQLAADGWTKAEVEGYQEILASMGRLDEGAAEMLDAVTQAADGISEGTLGARDAQHMLEDQALKTQDALVTGKTAADNLYTSTRNLQGASQEAAGKLKDLAGSAADAEGKLDGAYSSARNLGGALDSLHDVDITVGVHYVRHGDDGVLDNLSPKFVLTKMIEDLLAAAENPVEIVVTALGSVAGTGFANLRDMMESLIGWIDDLADIKVPTTKLKSFADALGILTDAISSLADLGDVLGDLGGALEGLGTAAMYGVPTGAFGEVVFVLERLAEWARMLQGVLVDLVDRMPTLKEKTQEAIEAVSDLVGMMDDLMGNLHSLGETLGDVGELLEELPLATVYSVPTGAFQDVVFVLERLAEWARMLQGVLVDLVDRMPELEAEAQRGIEAVTSAVNAINGLMDGLLGMFDVLSEASTIEPIALVDFSELFTELIWLLGILHDDLSEAVEHYLPMINTDANSLMDILSDTSNSLAGMMDGLLGMFDVLGEASTIEPIALIDFSALFTELIWLLEILHEDLAEAARTYLPMIDTGANELMDTLATTTDSVSGLVGAFVGFARALVSFSELGDIEAAFNALENNLDRLSQNLKNVLQKMVDMARDVLTDWEEGASLMADRAVAAAETAGAALGAFGDMIELIVTLGGAENLEAGLAAFEANIDSLEAAMGDVVNRMIALADTILTDWEEGASQIADTANAASEMVSEAFGALDSVIGALTGLVDMMGEVALVAGTEYLEEEDWAGLAWVITRVFQVTRTALERIRDAVVGLDTSTILDAASLIGHVGEAVGALSEAFSNINVRIPPTEGEIEGFLAALVDFYEALKSYIQHFRERLEDPFEGIDWYPYGQNMVQSLIDGINSRLPNLEAVLAYIRSLLPSSPAKRGPLSKPVDWSFLSDGLPDALSSVNAMLATPRFGVGMPDLQGAFAGAAGSSNFSWTINNPTREPEDIARDIRRAELVDRYKR